MIFLKTKSAKKKIHHLIC